MNTYHALAIALILLVLGWRRPTWALAAIVVGLPAYLLTVEINGLSVSALEAGILGLISGYALRSAGRMAAGRPVLPEHWQQVRTSIPELMRWAVVVMIAGWVVATAVSIDSAASLGALKSWLIEPLLVGLIALHEVRNEQGRTLLRRSMLAALLWVSVAGFAQLAFFPETVEDGRLSSVFAPVANYYAMFAAPLVILAAGWAVQRQDRGWAVAATVAGLLGIFWSQSYGGALAVFVGSAALVWMLLSSVRRRRAIIWLGVAMMLFGLAQVGSPYLREKINFSNRSSALVRTEIWRTAVEIGRQHPVFGIGPGTFEVAYRQVAPVILGHAPLEWLVAKPHNLYLNLWVETGLLGLIGTLAVLGIFLRRTMRPGSSAAVFAAAMIAILIHGLVDTPIFKNDLAVLAALIVAVGLSIGSRETKN